MKRILFPDFINASPKLLFVVSQVKKWLHCKVFLRQKEGLGKVSSILRQLYSDCRDGLCCIKHLIDTHPYLVDDNEPL